jgi:pyridoxamine 5'-phosphate oxidase-like protein
VTSSLPHDVRDCFERFITCEYTTVDARQQPITWPVTPYYTQGGPTIDLSTGLGYPKKAEDARRNPNVSLLFSDPTGSGVSGTRVLVQGTARVDDEDLDANRERYWRESVEKLPATKSMLPPKSLRGLLGWYFTRIYVGVRPERVFVWPDGDFAKEPHILGSHLEEVHSGHTEEPEQAHADAPPEAAGWDERIEELGHRHDTAVVSWVAPDGFPVSVRLSVEPDRAGERIRIKGEPPGLPLLEGRGCITAHSHAPDFSWQRNFQVRGRLARDGDGWHLVPQKLVDGFELPDEGNLARYRRNAKKMLRFRKIAKRQLKARANR